MNAPFIAAPSSTKNQPSERGPEMHQVKKGNEWHSGRKMHVAVDDALGLIHSLTTTPNHLHDITQVDQLLYAQDELVPGDTGYKGIEQWPRHKARNVDWFTAMRLGKRAQLVASNQFSEIEKSKASIRTKVEHCFHRIKRQFGCSKVRDRGLTKNTNRLIILTRLSSKS